MELDKAAFHLIKECGSLKTEEKLLIIYDHTTQELARLFEQEGRKLTSSITIVETQLAQRHGQEPDDSVAIKMLESDLIISICKYSLAHTVARIEAGKRNARFLSMPDYSKEMLLDPAVLIDYRAQEKNVRYFSENLTKGRKLRVKGKSGTDIVMNIEGRVGNCCPGFVSKKGDLGSPPDIEANISPVEHDSEGLAVIDGSVTMPEIGLLNSLIYLTIESGRITKIEVEDKKYQSLLEDTFGSMDSKRRILAECGIGLNPEARLSGKMLTDEGSFGFLHFGFGANHTVGGLNKVDFHLDFVFADGTIEIDDKTYLSNGKIVYE